MSRLLLQSVAAECRLLPQEGSATVTSGGRARGATTAGRCGVSAPTGSMSQVRSCVFVCVWICVTQGDKGLHLHLPELTEQKRQLFFFAVKVN